MKFLLFMHKVVLSAVLVAVLAQTVVRLLLDMPEVGALGQVTWIGLGTVFLYLQGALLWMIWGQEPKNADA